MEDVNVFLKLSDDELRAIAEANVKAWSSKNQRMCPPTVDNMFAGIKSELAVAKRLLLGGAREITCNGVKDYINTMVTGKPICSKKPDITCISSLGVYTKIEVKSGRPERFIHRQFIDKQVKSYLKSGINYVYWVDVFDNGTTEVKYCLKPEEIQKLPLKLNFMKVPCHTLTGGY